MEGWSLSKHKEVAFALSCLKEHYMLINLDCHVIAVTFNKDIEKYEFIYDDLEAETVDFVRRYFPDVQLIRVDNMDSWIEKKIVLGKRNHEI